MSLRVVLRRWLPGVVTLAVIAVLSVFLWRNRGYIADSYSLRPGLFVVVAVLTVASLFVRGIANRLHFGALGVVASNVDWFRLVTVTSFTNYLPLAGGLVAKAVFLKRVHEMPFARFAVGQTTLLLVIVATNGGVGLIVLATAFRGALFGVVGLGFAAMLASGVLLVLPERLHQMVSGRFFPVATNVGPELRRAWPAVAACQVVIVLAMAASLRLCFQMGDAPVGFAACVLFNAAAVLTRFVTVVPGALGVREFLIGGLAVLTGFDLRDAVVASTLVRAAEILVIFVLGGIFTWSFSRDVADGHSGRLDA